MERYKSDDQVCGSRIQKNAELYSEINKTEISRVRSNKNYQVIESDDSKNIDIEKIRRYVDGLNELTPKKSIPFETFETTEETYQFFSDDKEYDINKVIIQAKENRNVDLEKNKYKKLRNDGIEILKKIEKYDDKLQNDEVEYNTGEQTLIDLINTIHSNKTNIDLLRDLQGDENTIVTKPIEEEKNENILEHVDVAKTDTIKFVRKDEDDVSVTEVESTLEEKINKELDKTKELVELKNLESTKKVGSETNNLSQIDKSFYTNSMSFSKDDFEGFDELEKTVKKKNSLTVIGLILLFIAISATLIVIANYVFELGLF